MKSDLPDPVSAGEVLLYQILVTNNGPSDAESVVVTDTLDTNLTYVGGSPGCSANIGIVTCVLGDIPAGDSRSVLVDARVDPGLVTNTTLTNSVIVAGTTPDPNLTDNEDEEVTDAVVGALPPTDLTIGKMSTPDTVTAGEVVTYTLVVTNLGPFPASGVQVVDALPVGLEVLSTEASQGLCGLAGSCLLGSLPALSTVTITIVAVVDSGQTADLLNVARGGFKSGTERVQQ